jgi:acid phosphatase type 7
MRRKGVGRILRVLLLGITVLVISTATSRSATTTWMNWQHGWRYLDYGFLPAADWFSTAYSDAQWKFNYGQFGYGDGDEQTLISFGADPQNKFITTYFRTTISIANPTAYTDFTINLIRDDGAVVYLNGLELFRSNMPNGPIGNDTMASTRLDVPDEATPVARSFSTALLSPGLNYLAVELHQADVASEDLSFDMQIVASTGPGVDRGPYLQIGTPTNVLVRWRTGLPLDSVVRFGTAPGNLNRSVTNLSLVTEHEIVVSNLTPSTRYYYEIGSTAGKLAGDNSFYFRTAPIAGTVQPVRIWAIGDSGTGFQAQFDVADAYYDFTGAEYTDVWLMLGDNAYCCGWDEQYQDYLFNAYPEMLRQTVLWPTVGNHDTGGLTTLTDNLPYYFNFSMPTNAEAGGMASGSEHYYSFDYANIHFVCLDSMASPLRQKGSPQINWLKADLAETTRDWIIAYWHHPPYSRGSHNSDFEGELIQMRQNVVPILEEFGVDLVLTGHSHNYERSYLLDGWYAFSSEGNITNFVSIGSGKTNETGAYLKPAGGMGARRGTVYITDGSSGGQGTSGTIDHPAMYYSSYDFGSLVLDVHGQRLHAKFIRDDGVITDYFAIDKSDFTNAIPSLSIAKTGTNVALSWPTSLPDYVLESTNVLVSGAAWSSLQIVPGTNGRKKVVTVPVARTNEFFRLRRVP